MLKNIINEVLMNVGTSYMLTSKIFALLKDRNGKLVNMICCKYSTSLLKETFPYQLWFVDFMIL